MVTVTSISQASLKHCFKHPSSIASSIDIFRGSILPLRPLLPFLRYFFSVQPLEPSLFQPACEPKNQAMIPCQRIVQAMLEQCSKHPCSFCRLRIAETGRQEGGLCFSNSTSEEGCMRHVVPWSSAWYPLNNPRYIAASRYQPRLTWASSKPLKKQKALGTC